MSILIVGYDVDLSPIQEKLGEISSNVYFRPITFPAAEYEPSALFKEVPAELDVIVFVYSDNCHSSSQLLAYYAITRNWFNSKKRHYYCLESFREKHEIKERYKADKNLSEISFEQLQSIVYP